MTEEAPPGQAGRSVSFANLEALDSNLKPTRRNQKKSGDVARRDTRPMVSVDVEKMKSNVREALKKPTYNVHDLYHKTGMWQRLARNQIFENVTLFVISFNAIWMAVDTDNNDSATLNEADAVFQIAEHFFCFYFSFEWFVRFMAFRRKRDGLKDGWFVFDSALVFMMVLETWVMTAFLAVSGASSSSGGLGNTGILRLFRLLRLSRMARMLRSMPELMILIKGMVSATRSVFFTLCLLIIIMYIFAIALTQLTGESSIGPKYFASIPASMYTLLVAGVFFDNLDKVITEVGEAGYVFAALFLLFIALATLMVMNMLIGVLCSVVDAVAATEKEEMLVSFVRSKMREVVRRLDKDGNMMIDKAEFHKILDEPEALNALTEVDVDPIGLIDMIDFIFSNDDGDGDKELALQDFMDLVLQLRGNNTATVKDMVDLRKFILKALKRMEAHIYRRSPSFWLSPSQSNLRLVATGSRSPLDPGNSYNNNTLSKGVPDRDRWRRQAKTYAPYLLRLDAFLTAGLAEVRKMVKMLAQLCPVQAPLPPNAVEDLSGGASFPQVATAQDVAAQMEEVGDAFHSCVEELEKVSDIVPNQTAESGKNGIEGQLRQWLLRSEDFMNPSMLSELRFMQVKLERAKSPADVRSLILQELLMGLTKCSEFLPSSIDELRQIRERMPAEEDPDVIHFEDVDNEA